MQTCWNRVVDDCLPASVCFWRYIPRWSLIHWYKDGKNERYNIPLDIGENSDVAAIHPDIVMKLTKKLGDYLKSVDAQLPVDKVAKTPCPYPGD